jgi:hypothetical protein
MRYTIRCAPKAGGHAGPPLQKIAVGWRIDISPYYSAIFVKLGQYIKIIRKKYDALKRGYIFDG